MSSSNVEYAGFWVRLWATLIDTFIICLFTWPLLILIYGWSYLTEPNFVHGPIDFLLSWVLPTVAIILFWIAKQATPGKMAIAAEIVDARTGNKPTSGQLVGRYFGYFASTIPFGLGFLWVAFDPRKQGWHDKMAGTVVIRKKGGVTQPVQFEDEWLSKRS